MRSANSVMKWVGAFFLLQEVAVVAEEEMAELKCGGEERGVPAGEVGGDDEAGVGDEELAVVEDEVFHDEVEHDEAAGAEGFKVVEHLSEEGDGGRCPGGIEALVEEVGGFGGGGDEGAAGAVDVLGIRHGGAFREAGSDDGGAEGDALDFGEREYEIAHLELDPVEPAAGAEGGRDQGERGDAWGFDDPAGFAEDVVVGAATEVGEDGEVVGADVWWA